jgi:cytosine/adenosine deaminase-related metal-dependent hydrolase
MVVTGMLRVRGGIPVTADTEPAPGDLQIADGRFIEPTRSPAADSGPPGGDGMPGGDGTAGGGSVLDAADAILLPGLVNAHDHLRSFLPATRRSETMSLAELVSAGGGASAAAGPADYRALTALAAARNLRSGVTSVIDHVYPLHRAGLLEAVAAGHADVGLRGSIAVGMMTRGDARLCTTPQQAIALLESAADSVLPADRLFLAPVSLRQTDIEAYRLAARFADRTGVRLYTHISESADEVQQCLAEHGVRPVRLLADQGFLRPGTVLVHCVHLDDADIELLAGSGAHVVYCPTNHLRLAKGFAPVTALRGAGVNVCLGIDGMDDLFVEMRQAVYAQGQAAGRPGVLGTAEALSMATTAGAAALGVPGVTGRFSPGDAADLVVLRSTGVHLQPLADPRYAAVTRAHGADVTDVLVGGRPVLRDGRLTQADERELVHRARAVTGRLAGTVGIPRRPEHPWNTDQHLPAASTTHHY